MTVTTTGSSIYWRPGENVPIELSGCKDIFHAAAVLPRLLAWISTNDTGVSILNGYNAICYSPPTLMFASSAISSSSLVELQRTKRCSLSAVTSRESQEVVLRAMKETGESPDNFSFDDLGIASAKNKNDYPVVVGDSPIHMYCSLHDVVTLAEDESMILLTVETFVIDGSVLSPATNDMKADRSFVVAKIDADLISPWVGLGNGQASLLSCLADMPRPQLKEQGEWESTDLNPIFSSATHDFSEKYDTVEWSFRTDGRECSLGYNPVTALIMPRPIGWISTFRKEGRVPHVAPYSFFCDVARGKSPMVAFSGYRPNEKGRKDAQQDAEDMGCFACNLVTHDLAVHMNYSAAPLASGDSEFELACLRSEKGRLIEAPLVAHATVKVECEYVKTVDVPFTSFSIVIGKVVGMHIDKKYIHCGNINVSKLHLITRLGYKNEYGVIDTKR
ncbi:hypothetical protein MPSEU_001063100 [Mayamaea pseudoterrestris]|nr:hypothetical protein MPSEU_001063100 [Mayamaea pseudoterrestris]